MERKEEEKKVFFFLFVVQEEVKDYGMILFEYFGRGIVKLSVGILFVFEVQGDLVVVFRLKKGILSNDFVFEEFKYIDEICINGNKGLFVKDEILDRVFIGNGEGDVEMDEEVGDVMYEKSIGFVDVIDREGDFDFVFEGFMLLLEEDFDLEVSGCFEEGYYFIKNGDDSVEEIGVEELFLVVVEEVIVNFRRKDKLNSSDEEDVCGIQRFKEKLRLKVDDELYEKCKLKEKLWLRERSRSKRYDDEIDYERWKEKYCKYKRRYWYV